MRFARFVAATALAVAATPVLGGVTAAPAQAAGCSGAGGVTVVVDARALGGGVDESCVGSGGRADVLFASAGHRLEYQPGDPGYVCYVDSRPGANCGRDKAAMNYWSLWWSDGTSGSWVYSGLGVRSLNVPDGGYVAWVWQNAGSRSVPSTSAAPRGTGGSGGSGSSPSSPSNPGSGSGGSGSAGGSGGAGTSPGGTTSPRGGAARGTAPSTAPGGSSAPGSGVPGAAATDPTDPTGAPTDAPTTGATTDPAAGPTDAPTSAAPGAGETMAYDEDAVVPSEGSDAADEAAGGSVPWWALGIVAVVLAAGGGGVALARRRRSEAGPLL